MEQIVRIALLHAGKRSFGQRGFDIHHRLGMGLSFRRRLAHQLKHFLDVLQIFLPRLFRFGVGLGVVIAIGQAQAAGFGEGDDARGIRVILAGIESEHHAAAGHRQVLTSEKRGQIAHRFQRGDLIQSGFQRQRAGLLNRRPHPCRR